MDLEYALDRKVEQDLYVEYLNYLKFLITVKPVIHGHTFERPSGL